MLHVEEIDLYYGASQALKQVSFAAEKGKVSCVLGRNGVGKTSLLKAIAGHQPIKSGAIRWDEQNISTLAPYDRAKRGIAYVPQGREIFPLLTVQENLETGFAPIPRALRHIQDEIFDLFPVLKDMLGRRGGDLSGGQQQQLAIARALVTQPKLLVLDEPTEGIQPNVITQIGEIIRSLVEENGMTILLVEQYVDFVRKFAHSFHVMNRGRFVAQGHTSELDESMVKKHLSV